MTAINFGRSQVSEIQRLLRRDRARRLARLELDRLTQGIMWEVWGRAQAEAPRDEAGR